MTVEQRTAVIAEALSWEGTPYHERASVKGSGADCALMPLAVYSAVLGVAMPPVPKYLMQWNLHRSEEYYLDYVRSVPSIREIAGPEEGPEPGDFVLFRQGRMYSHGAIVLEWPRILHAVNPRGVIRSDASTEEKLRRTQLTKPLFFTFEIAE